MAKILGPPFSSTLFGKSCLARTVSWVKLQVRRHLAVLAPISNNIEEAVFETTPFLLHKLDVPPQASASLSREQGLRYYREMATIRRMEHSASMLYREKAIRGFCHLCTGQEACCVGIEEAITKEDALITAYRCHGWAYVRGIPLRAIFAELFGRSGGCSKGKGGSMHMYKKGNFYGGHGIVGAEVPLGSGVALALKTLRKPNVCVCLYGDGAANQGQVFEAFNMAALWRLPVVYVCENNHYGMGTSVDRASFSTSYYTRGDYIPGFKVDGQDVLSVREGMKFAREFALKNGPVIMELDTYRFVGHSVSDPGVTYRTRDEVDKMRRSRDPVEILRHRLVDSKLASEAELAKLDVETRMLVDEAVEQATQDPYPDAATQLNKHVYSSQLQTAYTPRPVYLYEE